MTPGEAQVAAVAGDLLVNIAAWAFVALFFGLGWRFRAKPAGRALIPLGLLLVIFLLAVRLAGPFFLVTSVELWRPLVSGLILGGGAVALFVAFRQRRRMAFPAKEGDGSATEPELPRWDELDEDQQDVLSLLSQQKGARVEDAKLSALIDNVGVERWNRVLHRLESRGLVELLCDCLTLTERGRGLMAGLPERGRWVPEGLVRLVWERSPNNRVFAAKILSEMLASPDAYDDLAARLSQDERILIGDLWAGNGRASKDVVERKIGVKSAATVDSLSRAGLVSSTAWMEGTKHVAGYMLTPMGAVLSGRLHRIGER